MATTIFEREADRYINQLSASFVLSVHNIGYSRPELGEYTLHYPPVE